MVKILFGNILMSKTEIIVSSDDCYLSMGGGLSKCILNAAGESLLQDAKKKDSSSFRQSSHYYRR